MSNQQPPPSPFMLTGKIQPTADSHPYIDALNNFACSQIREVFNSCLCLICVLCVLLFLFSHNILPSQNCFASSLNHSFFLSFSLFLCIYFTQMMIRLYMHLLCWWSVSIKNIQLPLQLCFKLWKGYTVTSISSISLYISITTDLNVQLILLFFYFVNVRVKFIWGILDLLWKWFEPWPHRSVLWYIYIYEQIPSITTLPYHSIPFILHMLTQPTHPHTSIYSHLYII